MRRDRVIAVEGVRAIVRRPSDSGVFPALHRPESANDSAQLEGLNKAPERAASTRRASTQRALAALLSGALRADGLADADAAAACDRSRQHVTDMRSEGGRAITLADGVLIAKISPSFRNAMLDLLGDVQ